MEVSMRHVPDTVYERIYKSLWHAALVAIGIYEF